MTWVFAVVVVLAMGGIALVAAGRGAPMVEEFDDRPDALVPASGDLGARDLRRVRFSLAVRGYRMSEVDALLSRLAAQLDADDADDARDASRAHAPVERADETADSPVLERDADDPTPG